MKMNMGVVDRIVRLIIVVIIAAAYYAKMLSGVWAIVLGIVAVAFLITGLVGWCPLYAPFGLSTKKGGGAGGSPAS